MRSDDKKYSIDLIKSLFLQNGLNTKESYETEKYDLLLDDGRKIEIKNRRFTTNQFITYSSGDGFILEKIKYDFLIDNNGLYIYTMKLNNYNIVLIWDVKKINTNFLNITLQSKTDFSGCYKKNKQITYLSIKDCYIYIKIDRWICVKYEKLLKIIAK